MPACATTGVACSKPNQKATGDYQQKALQGKWREIDLSGTPWKIAIELFLNSGAKDEVFIAPKHNPRYRVLLDGLWRLRDKGVFEET